MNDLMDMSLRNYSSLLSSGTPTPGGGSAAALAGTLAASLAMMVVNLTTGKKSYNALSEDTKQKINSDFEAIKFFSGELTALVDEDARAFGLYMDAAAMAKKPDADREKCEAALKEAAEYSMKVPLKTAEKCLEVLRNLQTIAEYGNKNAASDAGVGAMLALAGLEGAALNVRTNLPFIWDEELKEHAKQKIKCCLDEGMKLRSEIVDIAEKRIGC